MTVNRILFLSAWYPTRYDPMPGLFVKRHAEILTNNFDVSVLHTLAVDQTIHGYEIEKTNEDQIFTVRIYYAKVKSKIPVIGPFMKVWRFLKAYWIGLKVIRNDFGLPDLTHVNILTRTGFIACYLKLRYGIPYVITEHWTRYTAERKAFKGIVRKTLTKLIVSKSSGISAVSENLKLSMINYGLKHPRFLILHNVVDLELFKRDQTVSPDAPKIFSHISCFDNKAKNTNGIVQAVAALAEQRNDFLCLMVGEGPDQPEAERLAEKLGINDKNIRFTGLLEGEALVRVYHQSLFTILFSNYENMPVVISESFACGKPVIATNVGGIPEIVNNSNGILVHPGDVKALTNAMDDMLDRYAEFDAAAIRSYAMAQFGKESVLQQMIRLYQTAGQ